MTDESAVSARAETTIIPTYVPFPPDPNPMFLERRVNQGASGRVYPNPIVDRLADEKTDRAYRTLWLENEYLQLMMLPELGGRIQIGLDKTNDYDFFYRQHVIKPAMIGLLGPWISGGLEFNWPLHHRPSTAMHVHHLIEEHEDGSRTVWLSDHEPLERTKGMVGVCLYPGKAFVELKVRIYNRTPFPQTFLWWLNIAVRIDEMYQLFFPPDVASVTDHSKRAMEHFPIAKGTYYGVDYSPGTDISWFKNNPVASSFFAAPSAYDFFGGYDHGKKAGLVHVANHHISPGKKLFTWGTQEFAKAWERNLTDSDGPYIELMAGAYTDNQPDFSWLQPYETKSFSQFIYPFQQIGPAKNANRRVAINLEVERGKAMLGACATEVMAGATVMLMAGERELFSGTVDLAPGKPFVEWVELPEGVAETDLMLRVCDRRGGEIIRHAPEVRPEEPLPEVKRPPLPPAELGTNDELYHTGVHLEQYRHPTIDPEPYWEEALKRDPGDSRVNNVYGLLCLRRGDFAGAEEKLRRAIATITHRNPNPRDGEPYYNLGLLLKYRGDLDGAYDAFYKAIWSYAWQSAGYCALAQIDALREDYVTALDHLDRALVANAHNFRARSLKSAVLRRLGRAGEAVALGQETLTCDPLDFWGRRELALAESGEGAAGEEQRVELAGLMRADGDRVQVQIHLDLAFDYMEAGFWKEASDLIGELVGDGEEGHPMLLYARGYCAYRLGEEEEGAKLYGRAAAASSDYCFPARLEELQVLRHVLSVDGDDARACYYLGNLLYDKKQYDEAIELWERATRLDPDFSIPWRNLGIACYNVRRQPERARECYLKALAANPRDARLLIEIDQLMARLGEEPSARLARLEEHPEQVEERDDLCVARAALYNRLGQPERALEIISSRRFHPWEGGEGRVSDQYIAARLALGRKALEAGDAEGALEHFEGTFEFPRNLGEGPHAHRPDSNLHYYMGLALEAAGDDERARASFERTAGRRDLTPMGYYQGMALRKLGREEEAQERFREMLDQANRQLEGAAKKTGFDTSVPRFIFDEEDPQKRRRISGSYLLGLAKLGLGEADAAAEAFAQVLELDPHHPEAAEELGRLRAT